MNAWFDGKYKPTLMSGRTGVTKAMVCVILSVG